MNILTLIQQLTRLDRLYGNLPVVMLEGYDSFPVKAVVNGSGETKYVTIEKGPS